MSKKVMLIDGNSIIHRAFHAVPPLTNSDGKYTSAVYGFLNILFKLLEEEKPDYLAVAFDLHAPTFRHIKYEQYKGTRKETPVELRDQIALLKQVLTTMHIKIFEKEGFEADDILGTLSKLSEKNGYSTIVVSGDRDLLQLASDTLKVKIPKTSRGKTEIKEYYAQDVFNEYGVTPEEFIDVKALMGDKSDNIPGVPSIGDKTATKIIQQYKTIEEAIKNAASIKPERISKVLAEHQEQAVLSKFLATIVRNVPLEWNVEQLKIDSLFTRESYELFQYLEFKSFFAKFKDMDKKMQENEEDKSYKKITTKFDCLEFISSINRDIPTAYVILGEEEIEGISFYNEQIGGVWLEISQSLTREKIVQMTKDFFEHKEFLKIAHNAKKDIRLLKKYNVKLSEILFDTALAAYILNSTKEKYEYNDIASEFLNEMIPNEEEFLGKGKSKIMLAQLEEPKRTYFAVKQAEVFYQAMPIMQQKIEKDGQHELYYTIELPLLYVLADMECYGIKINKKELEVYQNQLEKKITEVTKEIYQLAGEEFNLNSPKQMGVVLFDNMKLEGGKKTKTGYSTAADVLESLKNEHPIIEKILYYRQLAKLKSTYADGLLNIMNQSTQKIYSTFHQTITATGRISSSEPNLQNIPIKLELGRQLRKVFIPTNEDYCFLDADYSQIELRILAHISDDETLIEAFKNNQDIHSLTASQVFHVPFEEVTDRQRRNAKAVNFGIIYGMGAFSLSEDLGISRKEAEEYIAAYFEKYPKIKIYMDKTISDAREKGYVSTMWNRRRLMPELTSGNYNQRAFGERVAMNMPIQGTAADIIKIAMIRVYQCLKERNLKSKLILQVHDELLIETYKEELQEVKKLLKYEMEQAAQLSVPLKVDVHEGNSWFEAK